MKRIDMWPPPEDWTECVVTWDTMLANSDHAPNAILAWTDSQPGGEYHLHGYKSTEGFAFRFRRAKDATLFCLRWL
jgi:hypothetical protein